MVIGVLGGNGFIGKNIVHFLSDQIDVRAISLREQNWREKVSETDILINLVGKAHDHAGSASENEYEYANVELVKEIYTAFNTSKNKLLIHFSSMAVVEEFHRDELLTEVEECRPVSWYGLSKRRAEQWLLSQSGKKVIILRPPMVHGVGDKGNLTLLYKVILKGLPYPLAAFENKRSFVAMPNLLFFIEQIIQKNETIASGIYHLADDECLSTNELINIIKRVTGRNGISIAIPQGMIRGLAKLGDLINLPLNTKRLKKLTGNMIVSNVKLKSVLSIEKLPFTAEEGLIQTIQSFLK